MLVRTWRTRDGQLIPINQMADSHLCNAINKIRRDYPRFRPDWLPILELELYIRDVARSKGS